MLEKNIKLGKTGVFGLQKNRCTMYKSNYCYFLILPQWKTKEKKLLKVKQFIVAHEAHYEHKIKGRGTFSDFT